MAFADPLGLVGAKLGQYVVCEAITEGGVAVIYRGEHDTLQSAVAIKVLIPDAVADTVRGTLEQMFLREAQILSQLRSEDILRALDHGRIVCPADGIERPYLVTDFLVGRPLSDDLEQRTAEIPRRPYTLEEAVTVLDPIARALSVCHANGIVHRDVNPRNVFLEDAGAGRVRAKLIDFGFAKEVYRTQALRLETVDATLFARSPDYAAPEHYDRETYGELSETTDIYTLALMLVEMLTLERPLRGVTDNDLWHATKDENDRPTPNNRGARVNDRVEALFAEAVAVDQLKRPQVLSEWWERLTAATRPGFLGAPGASRGVADSGRSAASGGGSDDGRAGASGRGFEDDREGADDDGEGGGPTRLEEATARRRIERLERKKKSGGVFVALGLLLVAAAGGAAWWLLRPIQCPAGFADCNGQRADGCETTIATDATSCGA
ncbi:MAG TPA: protein kinase, partial [Polyangiaceae bacterium]|nr:protein kinase [Polyangiaceae bacterium]